MSEYVPSLRAPGWIYPESYGAAGDDSTDDTAAITAAISDLQDDGVIAFRSGATYKVTDTIHFDGKAGVTVYGNGATIRPRSVSFAGKPALKFTDTSDSRVVKLHTYNTLGVGNRPSSSLAVGRSLPTTSCSGMQFDHCSFRGYATVGTLYRSGAELLEFRHCSFTNSQNTPAYYDDDADYNNIYGRAGTGTSNTEAYFYACSFRSYIGDNNGHIIRIAHSCKDLTFSHCYSTSSDGVVGGRGIVFYIGKDLAPANGSVCRFVINDWRAEVNDDDLLDQSCNRFMYIDNSNTMPGFEIRNVFMAARGTTPPDYLMEIVHGNIEGANIDMKDSFDIPATRLIRLAVGQSISGSTISVRSAGDISCDGTVSDCVVNCADGSSVPFVGTGNYSGNNVVNSSKRTQHMTGLYSFAVDGGAQTDHTLFSMPSGATITRAWYEIVAPFNSGGAATVSFGVATDDATGLKGATAYNHADFSAGYHDCVADGAAANFTTRTTAQRDVIMTVAGADLTAGVVRIWCECLAGD